MMEPASTSETLVKFYQTTRRYNTEDSHLHTRRRENLKCYCTLFFAFLRGIEIKLLKEEGEVLEPIPALIL
jgi:hypothetical protein